jgi:hypothetical protein
MVIAWCGSTEERNIIYIEKVKLKSSHSGSPVPVVFVGYEMKNFCKVLNTKVRFSQTPVCKKTCLMGTSELINHVLKLVLVLENGYVHASEDSHRRTPFGDVFFCCD